MSHKKKTLNKLGNIYGFDGSGFGGTVYDTQGICPAINTCGGGNREPLIIVKDSNYDGEIKDKTSN